VSLRIIAGALKGRRLIAPPGLETRPLPDRIKQSLFDWLGQDLSGLSVVDCCAGSGSFGFEALSRGARIVHLIEPGRHAMPALRANLNSVGSPSSVIIEAKPFEAVLQRLRDIDLIFADPPFPWFVEEPEKLTQLVTLATAVLKAEGRLVIRGERGHELPTMPSGARVAEKRFYGRSWVSLIRKVGK
jgi:16S rRNA (guanine966-N2)-methyltransferase